MCSVLTLLFAGPKSSSTLSQRNEVYKLKGLIAE